MTLKYYRKVIKIRAEDSPNVRLGMIQKARGETPTDEIIVPGVLPFSMYEKRRLTWDPVRQKVGLDAEWWEGADLLLYPPDWLDRCHAYHVHLKNYFRDKKDWDRYRVVKSIGVDVAQGGNSTSFACVDDYGLKELVSYKTPDTSVIVDLTLALMSRHNVKATQFWFDGGGGGKQIADSLARKGHRVNIVYFGEAVTPRPKAFKKFVSERIGEIEERQAFINRRAMMYYLLRQFMDPSSPLGNEAFAIPEEYTNLREELAPIPLLYDREQRIRMLPKNKAKEDSDEPCLTDLIGHSPDEADALVLACYGMVAKPKVTKISFGAI